MKEQKGETLEGHDVKLAVGSEKCELYTRTFFIRNMAKLYIFLTSRSYVNELITKICKKKTSILRLVIYILNINSSVANF